MWCRENLFDEPVRDEEDQKKEEHTNDEGSKSLSQLLSSRVARDIQATTQYALPPEPLVSSLVGMESMLATITVTLVKESMINREED